MKLTRILILMLLASVILFPAFSEDKEDSGFNLAVSLELGAETFNENDEAVSYQMLSIAPDISFGKIGIGMAFTLHYRFDDGNGNFDFRDEDWIPDSERSFWDIYLPIFRYVRYGYKGDPLYAKLGSIDDGTLGNGFLMNDYSNTNFLPELRIVGLAFDLDGSLFNFPYVGLETFSGNLANMDVFGTRLYVRPLKSTEIPILEELQVGTSAAFDRDPDALNDFTLSGISDPDMVSMYGADFVQPLIAKKSLSLALYGDVAFQPGGDSMSTGGMLGFGGQLIGFINYGINTLFLGDNFVPFYFDSSYDLYREDKYLIYNGDVQIDGYAGWLASLGFSFLKNALVFNTSLDAAFSRTDGQPSTYPHLKSTLVVGEGLLPGFFFDASYDKRYIEDFADLIDQENAVIGANVNYKTGPAIITLGYDLRYVPEDGSWETTAKLTSSISVY